jgi:hypothetical protein
MNLRLEIAFEAPTAEDKAALASVARELADDPQSVRVVPRDDNPHWLVAEFTMPTEAQYKAVDKIDRALRFSLGNRSDSIIMFPKTEQERRRSRSKTRRRRQR